MTRAAAAARYVDDKELCVRAMHLMANGTLEDLEVVIHPDARNHEDVDEPPASRGRGPVSFYATALWLRDAYADLRWDVHDVIAEGDLVVLHATMSGRHVRTFVSYNANAQPAQAFPATGKRFATTQTHWLRMADGKIIEHWANRDDLGTAMQLGWTQPSPRYLVRMLLATRRARREAAGERRKQGSRLQLDWCSDDHNRFSQREGPVHRHRSGRAARRLCHAGRRGPGTPDKPAHR